MSDIERLRNAVGMLRDADGAYLDDDGEYASVESAERQYVAALAAVEQELAALRLSYENASRAHFEATKRIDALTEYQAALEAEGAELRKERDARPTLQEIERALAPDEWITGGYGIGPSDAIRVLRALYAEKAKATEAPRER